MPVRNRRLRYAELHRDSLSFLKFKSLSQSPKLSLDILLAWLYFCKELKERKKFDAFVTEEQEILTDNYSLPWSENR